ncbi:MAG TPA: BrnT family toxin [Terriglobales bacterium]|nr:BrnT family toxin [Terriglobales bacterium]
MRYEWDERKRKSNLRKHGLDFLDAAKVFEGPMFVRADTREDYREERWTSIGILGFVTVLVAFTEPLPGVRRIVCFRKATLYEQKLLETALED